MWSFCSTDFAPKLQIFICLDPVLSVISQVVAITHTFCYLLSFDSTKYQINNVRKSGVA